MSSTTPPEIESRTCSSYDITIEKNNSKCNPSTSEEISASSVIDKGEIASRSFQKGITRDQVHEEIQSFISAPLRISNEIRSLLTIVMFLTRLPVPKTVDLHPGFLMKGMSYFPIIGMMIGLVVAVFYDLVFQFLVMPSVVAAAVSVGVGWILTGCFHEDGLSDSIDGIGGGWTRTQIFKIMTDSRVGTYGCAALGLYTVTKVQLLAVLGGSTWNLSLLSRDSETSEIIGMSLSQGAGPAMVVAHTVARMTSSFMIRCFDYVDDEQGPKPSFYAFMTQAKYLVNWPRVMFAMAFAWTVTALFYNALIAAIILVVVLVFAHLAGRYGNFILGGVMGDYLGATICLSELLVLTMLLSLQTQQKMGTIWQLTTMSWSELMVLDIGQVLHSMMPTSLDEPSIATAALLRFLVLVSILKAWITYASLYHGPYDTSGKETTGNAGAKTNGEADARANNDDNSPKEIASRILSFPTSTFQERYNAVQAYIDVLAKPVRSLGTLEGWAARLASLQRKLQPDTTNVACLIFAGDHGAAAALEQGGEGCSAYPQAVTQSILLGLHRGVAGASVLAKANNVSLRVVDVGVILGNGESPFQGSSNVISSSQKLPNGTKNYCVEPAMSAEECERCMRIGRENIISYVQEASVKVVALGEVGIGNTTSSSALIAALTGKSTKELCGGGAFATQELDKAVVSKKVTIVDKALAKHFGTDCDKQTNIQAADALAKLGGAEIAALVGAFLEASSRDIAVLVDGFIVTAAAMVAVSISPSVCRILFFASHSAEPGQSAAIEKIKEIALANKLPMDACPILSMGLRMGEATAALLAVPVLRSSAGMLSDMATIQDILP